MICYKRAQSNMNITYFYKHLRFGFVIQHRFLFFFGSPTQPITSSEVIPTETTTASRSGSQSALAAAVGGGIAAVAVVLLLIVVVAVVVVVLVLRQRRKSKSRVTLKGKEEGNVGSLDNHYSGKLALDLLYTCTLLDNLSLLLLYL